MIDFKKISRDVLAKLNDGLPPPEQRSGTEQLIASQHEMIVLACCPVLKEYHDALQTHSDDSPTAR